LTDSELLLDPHWAWLFSPLVTARPLRPQLDRGLTRIGEYLDCQVELLRDAHRRGDASAAELIRACLPVDQPLTREAAREAIARDHRYADWVEALAHADDSVDGGFEAACDAIQWGDVDALEALLDGRPELVQARSPFPHRAMLLHHVAANGIEVERQLQTPCNAVEIMRLLLERGAEPDAVCDAYSGRDTTLGLLVSSAHPAAAGVQAALAEELCRGGARVDGLDDDGAPLWTAISFGYTGAAEALARCGARADNVVFAAALGRLADVCGYFDADGRLASARAASAERLGLYGPPLEPGRLVDYALIYAALHGRRDVVPFLLDKQPDLTFTEPLFHNTAAGAAKWAGDDAIVALLAAAQR